MRTSGPTASERLVRGALAAAAGALLLLACAGEPTAAPPPTPPPTPAPGTTPPPPPDYTACPAERRIACTREWRPVCGLREDGTWHTYGNACDACADRAVRGHRPGACEDAG